MGISHLTLCTALPMGSTRHVQTYAGPIEIYGDKLMLCIIHDITEQKRLELELEHAALQDAMTGLLNRRQFYIIAEQMNLTHLPLQQQFSLLLVDTDHFKEYQRRFWSSEGGTVLIALSRTLEACSRKEDFVFRWGGEEFVILLPRTSRYCNANRPETIGSGCPHLDPRPAAIYGQHWRGAAQIAMMSIDDPLNG